MVTDNPPPPQPNPSTPKYWGWIWLFSFILSSLPVAHLRDAPRRRLVTGHSARTQDKTTERPAWFFNVLGVSHRHTGPRFNGSSERQLAFVRLTSSGIIDLDFWLFSFIYRRYRLPIGATPSQDR